MDLHGGHHWILGGHFRLFTIRDAKIMSYSSLLALNDDEFIRAMYGAKAVVEKKPSKTTVHIGKDNPNHTKKDLYDADF